MFMGETPANTSLFNMESGRQETLLTMAHFLESLCNFFSLLLRAVNDGKDKGSPFVYGEEIDCGC